ncbi:ABC transporter ATP-binding protein [Alkalibacter rhizosphaerae]|uniref:ABC transporter ATP-binding protein n=1 Tax=Alkalibacter rhizosphaerae TaxID=2815577 RepID=A0A975AI22_9FIRM|nr:ABC transporter ATP-binding protein [Alkalibacter rhizosphaerae]QSX09214.1 ABC transporter ATP-binding protein [Alkalibacter rhizosphaerae]
MTEVKKYILEIEDLEVRYGHIQALNGVNIQVEKGKIISIIGSNGAGKSTLLNTISGLVKPVQGKIRHHGDEIQGKPAHAIVKRGIVQVPEGRKIFGGLSVRENLVVGGFLLKNQKKRNELVDEMFALFPRLKEREQQQAGTLSGGEQQMLAICRGLMIDPELILLDEPSLGLAPVLVNEVFKLIKKINGLGITVLLVEQNAKKSLALSDYAYVLENGSIFTQGKGEDLLANEDIQKVYLGERATC